MMADVHPALDPRLPAEWSFTPLRGKVPMLTAWQRKPHHTADDLAEWLTSSPNLGLRTGRTSGVVVVDVDIAKGGTRPANLPETVTVETGGGGLHLYYAYPPGLTKLPNSAGKLGRHVDTRGDGGQVVFPGAVHPETGVVYRWAEGRAPWEIALAPLPPHALARLQAPNLSPYAQKALDEELEALRAAGDGTRNDTLNRTAFNLAQLVGGGALPVEPTCSLVREAALATGLSSAEVDRTIESAWQSGLARPRGIPERQPERELHESIERTILVPGTHTMPDGRVEVGGDVFSARVLETLPEGTLYRWERIVGEVVGEPGHRVFREISVDRLRLLIDRHCRLVRWRARKDKPPEQEYVSCSRDLGCLVWAAAVTAVRVRELALLTHYPVFAGADLVLSSPGYNASTGVLYDEPEDLQGIGPAPVDLDALYDLSMDFPFRDLASQVNLLGLMLTLLIRPAVGTVPMHLVLSSIERTGKGLLINAILGAGILGTHVASVQIGEREEEREKRITSLILEGATLCHLDNLPNRQALDSPSLAALMTAPIWKGRTLGSSSMPTLPNTLTLVGSANNLQASPEVSKRIVPIWLEPDTDHPETRADFHHPDILAHCATHRRETLSMLLGMITAWRDAGRRPGTKRLGGFEAWAAIVGGVLEHYGQAGPWLENRTEWTSQADEESHDLEALVEAWGDRHGQEQISAQAVLTLVRDTGVFGWVTSIPESGQLVRLTRTVLRTAINRPVSGRKIRRVKDRHSKNWAYRLEPIGQQGGLAFDE